MHKRLTVSTQSDVLDHFARTVQLYCANLHLHPQQLYSQSLLFPLHTLLRFQQMAVRRQKICHVILAHAILTLAHKLKQSYEMTRNTLAFEEYDKQNLQTKHMKIVNHSLKIINQLILLNSIKLSTLEYITSVVHINNMQGI